jgi:alpha-L-rhamnosidase
MTEPLGVEAGQPVRLSWKVARAPADTVGRQTAYRLVVEQDGRTAWDSREVVTGSQYCIVPGEVLNSNSIYRWKVAVYSGGTSGGVWSKEAKFTTGLMQDDWQGRWIADIGAPREQHLLFRRGFELTEVPRNVFAYVASCGYHELYVNGTKADGRVLAPALSRIDRRVLYVAYDITPLLTKGDNVVGIACSPGWSMNNYFEYYGKTRQALRVQLCASAGGGDFAIASDTTWLCAQAGSRNIGRFDFMDMGGELVDGRQLQAGDSRWSCPGFDDCGWRHASTVEDYDPVLSAHNTDPSHIIDTIPVRSMMPLPIPATQDTVWRVDMGKEFTGFLEAGFDGLRSGDTVVIQVSMRADHPTFVQATDSVGPHVVEEQRQRQVYIARGEDGETFRNRFNYFAGRYVHFRGLRRRPDAGRIKGLSVSSAPRFTAAFECSDTLFNRLFALDRRTYEMCHTEGVTVDCPNRERLGYGPEGAYQTAWGLGLPCFSSGAHYIKNVRDWADVQCPDGFINNVAPQLSDMYGCVLNGTALLCLAWEHYRLYGDRRILETALPVGRRWLGFLESHIKDGMLTRYADHGYFLGEWVSPGPVFEYAETDEALFFNNCAYAMTLDFLMKISRTLTPQAESGNDALSPEWNAWKHRLDTLQRALHARWYHSDTGTYLNGDQVRTAFALYAGIVPDTLRSRVEAHLNDLLRRQGYIDVGSFGRYPFYKTVIDRPVLLNTLCTLLRRTDYPGYGYFVRQGCTTLPEMWEINRPNSTVIHTSYTGISAVFIRGIAGIRQGDCGVDTMLVAPVLVDGLEWVRATVETPYGLVKSSWHRTTDRVDYRLTVPFGVVVRLRLPGRPEELLRQGEHKRQGAATLMCVNKRTEL